MKQMVIVRNGPPAKGLRLEEAPAPTPGPGQLRLRVQAAGVNFADTLARRGLYPDAPPLPYVPGYEAAGVVDAVGPPAPGAAAPSFRVGDPVLALLLRGGYAEQVVAPVGQVYARPEGMDAVTAAALPVQALTAYYALFETGTVRPGDRVLIHAAAGGVGLQAVQMALHAGATVFGTCGSADKVAFLRAAGVHHPIDYRAADYVVEVRRLGGGLDLVLDSLGGREIGRGMSLLRPGGRLASYGYAGQTGSWPAMILGFISMKVLRTAFLLRDSQGFFGINLIQLAKDTERMKPRMAAVLDLWRAGVLKPHVGLRFPLAAAAEAHAALEGRGTRGKVVLTMGDEG